MYFSCNVSFSSLPVFLPTILKEMGFTAINAQGLTAPPFFASFLVTIATTWVADRTQQRGLTIVGLSVVGGVGYILCATCTSVGVRYFGVFLAACGVFPSIANILPWVLSESSFFKVFHEQLFTNCICSRQPGLRYPPWWGYCFAQYYRPMWPFPGHQCLSRC